MNIVIKATKSTKQREAHMPKVHTMELDNPKEAKNIPKHDNPTKTS